MDNKDSGTDAADIITSIVAVGVVVAVLFPQATGAVLGGAASGLGAYLLRKAFGK